MWDCGRQVAQGPSASAGGDRLEEVHLLGVTQEACILAPPGTLGTLEPSPGTRVPAYFMAFPVGSSGSLGAKPKLPIFPGPQLVFPG